MLIQTIPEWHLGPPDNAEIAALLARCFDSDFGGRSYFSQRHHWPETAALDLRGPVF